MNWPFSWSPKSLCLKPLSSYLALWGLDLEMSTLKLKFANAHRAAWCLLSGAAHSTRQIACNPSMVTDMDYTSVLQHACPPLGGSWAKDLGLMGRLVPSCL